MDKIVKRQDLADVPRVPVMAWTIRTDLTDNEVEQVLYQVSGKKDKEPRIILPHQLLYTIS